jgi:hypothetical protein
MRSSLFAVVLVVSGTLLSGAAPPMGSAPGPAPPASPTPPAGPQPCVNPRDSADYVPGVDASGRPVAPADLPGGADVQISTEVYPILKSKNPQLNGVGVVANLPGLANRPICRPIPPPRGAVPHR